ncbi:MAG: septal ring lytic transglycosylase RlpA family protein [Candidatus Thermochlorobacter sp.]
MSCRSVARFTSSASASSASEARTVSSAQPTRSAPNSPAPSTTELSGSQIVLCEEGIASYYAAQFHGRRTSSGEIFDVNAMTAAHLNLPFGTRVRVTNLSNNKSVIVRINDRLPPNNKGRIIDLSPAAARQIEMIQAGVVKVRVETLSN